jgi:hypothetical protein
MIERAIDEALDFCQDEIHGRPLDMVVEARLRAELPILAPAQFLSDRHFLPMPDPLDLNPMLRRLLPRALLQGVEALIGAFYLLADHRHGGATDFAARYKTRPAFGLMQKLFSHWKARFPDLGAGGHFDLVDEFADRLGMEGLCGWRYFPAGRTPAARAEACAAVGPTKTPIPEPDNPVLRMPRLGWPRPHAFARARHARTLPHSPRTASARNRSPGKRRSAQKRGRGNRKLRNQKTGRDHINRTTSTHET